MVHFSTYLDANIYYSKYSQIFESRITWQKVAANGKEDIIRKIRSKPRKKERKHRNIKNSEHFKNFYRIGPYAFDCLTCSRTFWYTYVFNSISYECFCSYLRDGGKFANSLIRGTQIKTKFLALSYLLYQKCVSYLKISRIPHLRR